MTLALVSPTSSFEESNIGFIPPIADDSLKLWHFFGSKFGPLGKNMAIGVGDSAVIGTPVTSERYVSLIGATNFLESVVTQQPNYTLFAIARSPATNPSGNPNVPRPFIMSTFGTPRVGEPNWNGIGASFYIDQPTTGAGNAAGSIAAVAAQWSGVAGSSGSVIGAYATQVDTTAWHLCAFVKNGVSRAIYDLTDNKTATKAAAAGQQDEINTGTFRIGSAYSGDNAPIDIAHVSMYYRALTLPEINTMGSFFRTFYAKRGIVI
ncbi:hypothetical protein [Burkholderia cepacia]|uniref:hypothetical protein n=1 Tax=Burkholderia cepacia TaxID=292 RepID=UPI002652AC6E|nr:hypothetical protein [Burkholderia cepacia]MDN7916132.1 hypothetical protein [Burkholderia cepacia]